MTSDGETTVAELKAAVAAFVAARDWQPFHTPKNLAMSVGIEAAELMECFQWLTCGSVIVRCCWRMLAQQTYGVGTASAGKNAIRKPMCQAFTQC